MFLHRYKRLLYISVLIVALFSAFRVFAFFSSQEDTVDFSGAEKKIGLDDNGHVFTLSSRADTVSRLLEENKVSLSEHDAVTPEKDTRLFSGMNIKIERATKIFILADGKKTESYVFKKTVRAALQESGVALSRLDKTTPGPDSLVSENMQINVTRINIEEITKEEPIEFKTIVKNDSSLGWQEKEIETPGEKGKKEVKYKITYRDGKEVSRIVLGSQIVQDPVPQTEVHGTYMELGKANKGQGTWYAYKGGMFAASTTIPKGAYAKVTNTANGKSVIVQINDYGPQGKGRIIDLDKVAFQKIASLGAGVIGVKVEQILN